MVSIDVIFAKLFKYFSYVIYYCVVEIGLGQARSFLGVFRPDPPYHSI